MKSALPTDAAERKNIPVGTGVLDYFPAALLEIARVSKAGNDQHNPGQPLHWARNKSTDHSDTIIRHWMDRGTIDTDGMRHSAKMAWRALALLQEELEAEGAPRCRGGKDGSGESLQNQIRNNDNSVRQDAEASEGRVQTVHEAAEETAPSR